MNILLPYRQYHNPSTTFKALAKEPVLLILKNCNNCVEKITSAYNKYIKSIDNLEKVEFSTLYREPKEKINKCRKEYFSAKKEFELVIEDKEPTYLNQKFYDKLYMEKETKQLLREKTSFKITPYIDLNEKEMKLIQNCLIG